MDHIDFRTSSTFMHSTYSLSLSLSTLFFFLSPTLHFLFSFVFIFFGVHNRTSDLSLSLDKEWFDSFFSLFLFNIHLFLSLIPSLSLCLSIFFHILPSLVLIFASNEGLVLSFGIFICLCIPFIILYTVFIL